MTQDILAVAWKEWRCLFRPMGGRWRLALNLLIPVGLIGIYMPLDVGPDWGSKRLSLLSAIVVPLIMVGMTIPDSFAGERERHTLETLLASRLSDQAILLGKVGVSVVFAWAATGAMLLASLVTANLAYLDEAPIVFSPGVALGNAALSLIFALFMAGAGVLISLRAETVQGAAQALMGIILVPAILVQFAFLAVVSTDSAGFLKDWLDTLTSNADLTLLIAGSVFLALALVLLALARVRFRRARLLGRG